MKKWYRILYGTAAFCILGTLFFLFLLPVLVYTVLTVHSCVSGSRFVLAQKSASRNARREHHSMRKNELRSSGKQRFCKWRGELQYAVC